MGLFCYVQLLGTSSSLQQQQWLLVNASSSSSSFFTSCSFKNCVPCRLHLHKKHLLRTGRRSSSSRMRVYHSRELGLGLVAMADGEREEEEREQEVRAQPKKNVNGRVALDILDEQIQSLSATDNKPPSSISSSAPATSSISRFSPPGSREEDEKVSWPEFSDGFFVYVGVGLLLLTVINNIAFRLIFGPVEKPVRKVSSTPRVRYRIRSQNEITSLDAPALVDAP